MPAGIRLDASSAQGFIDASIATVGQPIGGLEFGNVQLGSISGSFFNDANNNGVRDAGETGAAGWQIYIDANNNGTFDAGDTSTLTAADGSLFVLRICFRERIVIRDVVQSGWLNTFPAGGSASVSLVSAQNATGVTFGAVKLSTINVYVFNELNANGAIDSGDTGVSGVTVFIDSNNDGLLTTGEPQTQTDSGGNFSFAGLRPGAYHVIAISPNGWRQTLPAGVAIPKLLRLPAARPPLPPISAPCSSGRSAAWSTVISMPMERRMQARLASPAALCLSISMPTACKTAASRLPSPT